MQIHRGWYVAGEHWKVAYAEERHLLAVFAAHEAARGAGPVFAIASAGVAWELPLFRVWPRSVHIIGPANDGQVRPGRRSDPDGMTPPRVAHHDIPIPDEDVTQRWGVACTTLERTVYDVIRVFSREAAVACMDAALRRMAAPSGDARDYDDADAEEFRGRVRARIAQNAGARGIRQARWVCEFGDGRAELPGESVSRVYLNDLGFRGIRTQVPVPGPRGTDYRVDFGIEDALAWGEFDGEGKYTDPELLRGRTREDVVREEKEREDWIRATTGRGFGRWQMAQLESPETLGGHLAALGIRPRPS
ncbi:hypothetical protein ACH3VR_17305 [Microbacterium sp. B2969]|uniref:Transcriptional regulator, AbiEi antitoxin, Type IV TA system n=1 Tax=Microbacterium alkaliflavum TaxID=3248839 RepID=A0ABW7QB62_9MICO